MIWTTRAGRKATLGGAIISFLAKPVRCYRRGFEFVADKQLTGANVKHLKLGRPSILAAWGLVLILSVSFGHDAQAQRKGAGPGGGGLAAGPGCTYDRCVSTCLEHGGVGGSSGTPNGNCSNMCVRRCAALPEYHDGH